MYTDYCNILTRWNCTGNVCNTNKGETIFDQNRSTQNSVFLFSSPVTYNWDRLYMQSINKQFCWFTTARMHGCMRYKLYIRKYWI